MKFLYNHARISLAKALQQTTIETKRLQMASKQGYDDDRASINCPVDKKALAKVKKLVKAKKGAEYLVVVGIGGSNLGTIAVQEAVLGKYYNDITKGTKVLYADTVDADSLHRICSILEPVLKKGKRVLVNGVSKSGGTTETIANFEVFIRLLKKHKKNYAKDVVVTTDEGSKFWHLAKKQGFEVLPIPKKVGGRYSVFSPVGLFPLGILGVNLDKLLAGAAAMRTTCLKPKNDAAKSAALLYTHYKKGITIADHFLFSNDLEFIGRWYRQLMGESVGKEYDRKGKKINCGMTPTVSIGSTDLHSMAQLYLGGPFDKYTTFIEVEKNNHQLKVPSFAPYSKLVDKIQGKKLSTLMGAILKGVQTAFVKNKRPFCEIILKDKSASTIGALLQFKMFEMMYLGALLGVNPFDQPNVESYKIETKKILAK